ncbi:hypothetical protein [Acinetobacter sp. 1125_18A]|uniref:hypothetical protein n=1 Tax=Acinetobacter sp. 1125_18A TaxID=2605959 RepID=UPI004059F924
MKKILFVLTCISISHFAYAKTQNYILTNGGGVDDNGLLLKNTQGKTIYAYCNQKCGQWFDHDEETGGQILKKEYIEKRAKQIFNLKKMQIELLVLVQMNLFTSLNKSNLLNNLKINHDIRIRSPF